MDKILKIQTEIGVLAKNQENPFFKSKYFDVNQIIEQLLPLLEKYELTVVQPLKVLDSKNLLTTIVFDKEKEILQSEIILPELQDPQKIGSAITYYRRYALQSMFLLQAQDDDANFASKPTEKPLSKANALQKKSAEAEANGEEPF